MSAPVPLTSLYLNAGFPVHHWLRLQLSTMALTLLSFSENHLPPTMWQVLITTVTAFCLSLRKKGITQIWAWTDPPMKGGTHPEGSTQK